MGKFRCFECGKDLGAMPSYLGTMPGMKMRCQECAERSLVERPPVTLETLKEARTQMTISRQRVRKPKELSEEFYKKLVGLQRAA
jgi:DNA-directed RNA polymerase subunit RPC12/RpoP